MIDCHVTHMHYKCKHVTFLSYRATNQGTPNCCSCNRPSHCPASSDSTGAGSSPFHFGHCGGYIVCHVEVTQKQYQIGKNVKLYAYIQYLYIV